MKLYDGLKGIGEAFFAGTTTTTMWSLTDIYPGYIAGWTDSLTSDKATITGAQYFGYVHSTHADSQCVSQTDYYQMAFTSVIGSILVDHYTDTGAFTSYQGGATITEDATTILERNIRASKLISEESWCSDYSGINYNGD